MKISGRLRHTSTHNPATKLTGPIRDSLRRASARPAASESTIAMAAISRLISSPSRMNRRLLPVTSHSQLSGSKM